MLEDKLVGENLENEKMMKGIIFAAVVMIIALVLFMIIRDQTDMATNLRSATKETVTIASGAGVTANRNYVQTPTYFGNTTFNTSIAAVNIGDEINVSKTGVIRVSTANFTDGAYQITYDFGNAAYVDDGTSRTLVGLIVLFFAIAILMIGYNWVKDYWE